MTNREISKDFLNYVYKLIPNELYESALADIIVYGAVQKSTHSKVDVWLKEYEKNLDRGDSSDKP